ncbi:hypothetical protein M0657_001011 [Pyricularia oryzae]|uniref:Uncharacterized protein n=2 Tax=Pyricularia oryzae TaxID=318829 RepID=A0AA97PM01_PYRO3|nr:hypothetical protein OOU_Y34scaffold00487g6 [Pyricularia oryzae Y34]KAI7924603.1 hypothetical protein M9X92_003803 [Pyricularia oryzae]KAI7931997.1 hypothetical protein M0657_001011 [Pyricularia oryzae]
MDAYEHTYHLMVVSKIQILEMACSGSGLILKRDVDRGGRLDGRGEYPGLESYMPFSDRKTVAGLLQEARPRP